MMPKGAVCAEVGVWEGNFSERILNECDPKELNLIDPWLFQPEFNNTAFGRRLNEHLMEDRYLSVVEKFKEDPRVAIHRAKSEDGLAALPDHSLDWIYLDGNHNEPFIGQDLEMSLRKVKLDGIISGDDFYWERERCGAPVKRAVEALIGLLGARAKLTLMANQYFIQLKRS